MIDEATITARIVTLEAELVAFVAQANARVQAYQVAIGELQRLIEPGQTPATEYVEQVVGDYADGKAAPEYREDTVSARA